MNSPSQLETATSARSLTTRQLWLIIALAAGAFALKVAMAYFTYGTNDVLTWRLDLLKIHQDGTAALYRDGVTTQLNNGAPGPTQIFSHPPSMVNVLLLLESLAAL